MLHLPKYALSSLENPKAAATEVTKFLGLCLEKKVSKLSGSKCWAGMSSQPKPVRRGTDNVPNNFEIAPPKPAGDMNFLFTPVQVQVFLGSMIPWP
jgi:hypothetical protein